MQDPSHVAVLVSALQLPNTFPLAQLVAPLLVTKRRVNALAALAFLTQVLSSIAQLPTQQIIERLKQPIKTRADRKWLRWVEKEIVECLYEYEFYLACPAYTQRFLETVRNAHGACSTPTTTPGSGGVWEQHHRLEVLRDLYKNVIGFPLPAALETENFYATPPVTRERSLQQYERATYRHLTALDG